MSLKTRRIEQIYEKAKLITKAKEMREYYAQFKLKPLQLKFLDLVIAYSECEGDKFNTVTFPTKLLCTHLGMESEKANLEQYHRNAKVKQLALSMMIPEKRETAKKTTITSQPWFERIEIEKRTGSISVTLCSKLTSFLDYSKALGIKENFHQYTYDCVKNLHSRESIILYMLLHSVLKCENGVASFSIDELKQKLCLKPDDDVHSLVKNKNGKMVYIDSLENEIKNSHTDARNFKRVVLIEALSDINENTNIYAEYGMLPEGVPAKKKDTVQFFVKENENYEHDSSITSKKRKAVAITDVNSNSEVIQKADSELLIQIKNELLDTFHAEANEYISIIEAVFKTGSKSIEDISYRVARVITIKEFLNQYPSGDELFNLIKLNNLQPGLLRHSFKRTNEDVIIETQKLQEYLAKPVSVKAIQPSAETTKKTVSDEEIEKIALSLFDGILTKYKANNTTSWNSKVLNFNELAQDNNKLSSSLNTEVVILCSTLANSNRLTWCIFSMEDVSTKMMNTPLLTQIQKELEEKYGIDKDKGKSIASKRVKALIDDWVSFDMMQAITNNKLLKKVS